MIIINKEKLIHVKLQDWFDIASRKTGNPLVEEEILNNARQNRIIINDEDISYVPVERNRKWACVQIVTIKELENIHHLSYHDINRLIAKAGIEPFGKYVYLFHEEPFFNIQELKVALEKYANNNGLSFSDAALELGITGDSFRKISSRILFNKGNRYIKEFLEAFRRIYQDRHTIWSSRTHLLIDFIEKYNSTCKTKSLMLEPQYCEIPKCSHVASSQCANLSCVGAGKPTRYICMAHGELINTPDIAKTPKSLCTICAKKVRDGKLPKFDLL
jgi:hypothetical protein